MKKLLIFALFGLFFSPSFTLGLDVGLNCPVVYEWSSTGYAQCNSDEFGTNGATAGTATADGQPSTGSFPATIRCTDDINQVNPLGSASTQVNFIDRHCWKPGNESTHGDTKCNCDISGAVDSYTISASPNPVQVCAPANSGSSNISWSVPTGAGFYIKLNGNQFVSGNGGASSQLATGLSFPGNHIFNLYKTSDNSLKGSVTVPTTDVGCGTPPADPVCGNGIVESSGGEQCDAGANNGVPGSGCDQFCGIEGATQTVDLGWTTPAPHANVGGTVQIASGQTTTSKQIYWTTTGGMTGCHIYKMTGASGSSVYTISNANSAGGSTVLSGLTAGSYEYGMWCSSNSSVIERGVTLTVQAPSATPSAKIGFSAGGLAPTTKTIVSGVTTMYYGVSNVVPNSCFLSQTPDGGVASYGLGNSANQIGSFSVPRGTVGGSTSFSYVMICQNPYTNLGLASNSATLNISPAGTCGDNICNDGETCSSCSADCGLCSGITLNATCLTNPTVPVVRSGQPFTVNVPFTNTGSDAWTPSGSNTYLVRSTSLLPGWDNITQTLATTIAGDPIRGTFLSSFSLTAPFVTANTTYSLSFIMNKNAVAFGTACPVNVSTGNTVTVTPPRCGDGIDNDIDGKTDCNGAGDPGCFPDGNGGGGACSILDDDEYDAVGAVLSVSASPQLVRQGGSSTISYDVAGCKSPENNEGEKKGENEGGEKLPWNLSRDGAVVASGTESSNGPQTLLLTDIQSKTTFTLTCSGTSRSATVSVIKIGEF